MAERDWADGEPWLSSSERETCSQCGAVNIITAPDGPVGGHESYEAHCANPKCGAPLDPVRAFGHPTVKLEKKAKKKSE